MTEPEATADPTLELRRMPLFSALDEEQLGVVMGTMRVRRLHEGDLLFQVGDEARHFFFMRGGLIKLFRNSPDGGEKVIELVRPGQTFAEAVMFMDRDGYPVSAAALEASELLAFERRAMVGLLRESVETCFRMMGAMSRRLRQHVEEIDRLTLHSASYRLAGYLAEQIPEGADGEVELRLDAPKHVIASRLAIQPETFSRILSRFTRQGLVEVQGSTLRVLDSVALRSLSED